LNEVSYEGYTIIKVRWNIPHERLCNYITWFVSRMVTQESLKNNFYEKKCGGQLNNFADQNRSKINEKSDKQNTEKQEIF